MLVFGLYPRSADAKPLQHVSTLFEECKLGLMSYIVCLLDHVEDTLQGSYWFGSSQGSGEVYRDQTLVRTTCQEDKLN